MGRGRPFPNLRYGNPNVTPIPVPEREERSRSQQFRAVLMKVEAIQRAGPTKEGSRPCHPGLWMPFLCLCGERGEPLGRKRGTSSAPTPGLCLSQAPGRRGYCWCQGGAVSAESRNFYQASSTKRKENPQSKIRGTGPSHPTHPSCTKKCKHYHKKGVSERPFA